jgi:uncharacterized Rmd1/YagE family protein
MDPINQKLEDINKKLDLILVQSQSAKRHSQIVFWITIALIVLPLIGLVFAIPSFLSTYNTALNF